MKKEILSKAIDNIDTSLIEKSLGYKPRAVGGAKIRIIALAACLAIIVTAIPAALIMNREYGKDASAVTVPEVTTPKNVVVDDHENEGIKPPQNDTEALDIVFCSAESDAMKRESLRKALEELAKREVNEVLQYVPYDVPGYYEYERLEYTEDIPKTLNFTLGGKEYNCTFDYAYNTAAILSTNETLKSYAPIAQYRIDGKDHYSYALYSIATKEIVQIMTGLLYNNADRNVSQDEIRVLAEKDIISLYGEEVFGKYTFEYISYNEDIGFSCYFRRYLSGYMTRERIIMKYNGNGELLFISAEFLHAFDIFENGIDEKKMLEVEATVLNNFDGNLVTLKELCMGNDGLPYMNAVFRYEDKKTGKLKSSSVWYRISAN